MVVRLGSTARGEPLNPTIGAGSRSPARAAGSSGLRPTSPPTYHLIGGVCSTVGDFYKELEELLEKHGDCALRPCFNANDGIEGVAIVSASQVFCSETGLLLWGYFIMCKCSCGYEIEVGLEQYGLDYVPYFCDFDGEIISFCPRCDRPLDGVWLAEVSNG